MISAKLKFVIAGVVLAVAVGYLIFNSVATSAEYYLTVGELRAKAPAVYSQNVRVAGIVESGTIVKDARSGLLQFTAEDSSGKLPVEYKGGAVPDIFGPGIQVVVEGKYAPDGTFQANNLLAQCPSRYEDAVQPPAS
ncbi:MAG TPA: cytochrome c maturation protein CcmE [Chloroflexota bacterium]|nr:cytochrome c maturation protein CcmE [Chloroflexota bacterium]